MCGILAVLLASDSNNHKCFHLLLSGLRALQNRGYDSCGVIDSNFKGYIRTVKGTEQDDFNTSLPDDAVDQMELKKQLFPEHSVVGMGHTRWATHGSKCERNAHPHLSFDNKFAVVHNGIIENCLPLKIMMEKEGIVFRSETDTEVISNWLAYRMKQLHEEVSPGMILRLIREGQTILEGTWGISVIHKDLPDHVFVTRKGSPLLIGCNSKADLIMATSEISGFVNNVDHYAVINDGDVLELRKGFSLHDFKRMYPHLHFMHVPKEKIYLTPEPFSHWMSKEIYDQVEAVKGPGNYGQSNGKELKHLKEFKNLFTLREKMLSMNKNFDVLIVGCGTSYHAGLSGRWFFESSPFRTVRVVVASEFTEQDLPKSGIGFSKDVIAIMISQSGETKDVHRALSFIRKSNIHTIALVNVPNSMIARECDYTVHLYAGREVAVASTKAYVSQIVGLRLIALALEQGDAAKIPDDCYELSSQIQQVLDHYFTIDEKNNIIVNEQIDKIAKAIHKKNHGFILSTGILRAISYEAALKIKEIARVWVQGYPTGALKHGPFSLIEDDTPVLFSLQDENESVLKRTESAIEEIYTRKGKVFIVTDIENYVNKHVEEIIYVPKNKHLSPILHIIPFQILSYHLSLMRGLDPDRPIHLAKVVTTD